MVFNMLDKQAYNNNRDMTMILVGGLVGAEALLSPTSTKVEWHQQQCCHALLFS